MVSSAGSVVVPPTRSVFAQKSTVAPLQAGPYTPGTVVKQGDTILMGETLPLPCVSTAFVAKTVPFLAAIRVSDGLEHDVRGKTS